MFRIAAAVFPLLLLFACEQEGVGVNITVEGAGFEEDSGLTVKLALVRVETNEIIADKVHTIDNDGVIRSFWRRRFLEPSAHRVDAFIDVNRNDICEFGIDKTFSFELELGTEDTGFTFIPMSGGDPRGCLSFGGSTLTMRGTNVRPNKGLHAALIRAPDGTVLDVQHIATGDGSFEVEWAGGIRPGGSYYVDWFVDSNSNSTCDVAQSEGPWRVTSGLVDGDPAGTGPTGTTIVTNVDGNDTSEPAACESFPNGV